ncbi:hypothetical protein Tco_0401786 [Tanacetum coccineum]
MCVITRIATVESLRVKPKLAPFSSGFNFCLTGALRVLTWASILDSGLILGLSDDDKTQSNNENESDSKHETDENELGSESDQEVNEEDEDDEEEMKDELVKTPSNESDDEDEIKITDKAEVDTDKEFVQEEGTNAAMTNEMMGPVTRSSHSSDLADKFLNFSDIPHTDAKIVFSSMVFTSIFEVPARDTKYCHWFLVLSLILHQYSPHLQHHVYPSTPYLQQSTSTPLQTTEATNPPSTLPDFAVVFQFNKRVATLEKEVVELKKDPLHTQVTALVDDHLDTRLGATKEEFMNFLSASLTARITKHIKNQLPQILPEEAAAMLTKFELKKILIYKMDKSESYLAAPEHIYCYEGLIKSYDLDKTILSTYGKVYSLKRSQKDKDKDEDPSAGSDQGLKKRKASKDTESTKEDPEFKVADSDMPTRSRRELGKERIGTQEKVASKRNWFTKPTQPKEPIDPDWNVDKTSQQGQNQSWLMTLASSADKPSKTFDELMSTPIDFSTFSMDHA